MNRKENSKYQPQVSSVSISVIVPFYGAKKPLNTCIKGIIKQSFNGPFELIVVESGNDFEVKQLVNSVPNAVLISSSSLMFPGKARNLGVVNAKAEFIAFIDADCFPLPYWLSEIYSSLKKGNEIVIGPITNLYPLHPIASVDNLLQFPDFQKRRPSNNIKHFPACNMGLTKELFTRIGGFREDVGTGEDVTFSELAIQNCNDKIFFNSQLIVRHSGRRNLNQLIKHNESLGFHRGYLSLKISPNTNKYRGTFLYAFLFGCKRLAYISLRTLQWNPVSILRILFFFPFVIIGLFGWVKGFWKGNQKFLEAQN